MTKIMEASDFDWENAPEYKRLGLVEAKRLKKAKSWVNDSGDKMQAEEGDYLVWSATSEWTVKKDVFESTYENVEDTFYEKVATIQALLAKEKMSVATLKGIAIAHVGDYIAKNHTGEIWPIPKDVFLNSYSAIACLDLYLQDGED